MNILVTGGSGFLGKNLLKELKKLPHAQKISSVSRGRLNNLKDKEINFVNCDLQDEEKLRSLLRNVDVVFHTAAKAGIWGSKKEYWDTNVNGTEALLKACKSAGVRQFVYTSSPSVVFSRSDVSGVNERMPYAKKFLCSYSETKAVAEQKVLSSNGVDGMQTIALRPHLIWGEGDNHLIPTLLKSASRLRIVGSGQNLVDLTHVDNVVHAHLLALKALQNGSGAGKAYFISQGEPVCLFDWINELLERLGMPIVSKKVSFRTCYTMGCLSEIVHKFLPFLKEPTMTRFLALQLAKDHYFDINAAKKDLQYIPKISNEEGVQRLVAYLKKENCV